MTFDAIDQMAVSTIRSLSIEAIQAANSGHPGLPMGAAPMAYVLWNHVMNVNPKTSRNWTNRDRFALTPFWLRRDNGRLEELPSMGI